MEIAAVLVIIAVLFIVKTVKVVPQQEAWVVERLGKFHASLAPGAQLLIAEPMAQIPGAEPMGEAFFGLYLWAMGSGRPRSPAEIITMLKKAGFASARSVATAQPVNASVIIATV